MSNKDNERERKVARRKQREQRRETTRWQRSENINEKKWASTATKKGSEHSAVFLFIRVVNSMK